jgi:hypothetical protein
MIEISYEFPKFKHGLRLEPIHAFFRKAKYEDKYFLSVNNNKDTAYILCNRKERCIVRKWHREYSLILRRTKVRPDKISYYLAKIREYKLENLDG